jgi:hypothetical protein
MQEVCEPRFFPMMLYVRDPSRYEDQVEGTLTHHLMRDMNAIAVGVSSLCRTTWHRSTGYHILGRAIVAPPGLAAQYLPRVWRWALSRAVRSNLTSESCPPRQAETGRGVHSTLQAGYAAFLRRADC